MLCDRRATNQKKEHPAASPLACSSIPQTAAQSVSGVDVRIAGSRLPIAISVIVATTVSRIVAPAEWDADPDAKVRTSPKASTVVITATGVEPARIVAASSTVVSAAIVAAAAGIAAARVRGDVAARTAGIAAAGVGRGRIAASPAA